MNKHFISNMQLDHYTTTFKQRTFPITLVCENVSNAPNIGSLFRTADAFGIEKLILCGNNIPLGRKMSKTSRSTENYVDYEISNNALEIITNLKRKGYQLISLEITDNSEVLHEFQCSKSQPIALVVGDENFGVSDSILKRSDRTIHIEMFGKNSSMNVVQAASVALYEITRQFL